MSRYDNTVQKLLRVLAAGGKITIERQPFSTPAEGQLAIHVEIKELLAGKLLVAYVNLTDEELLSSRNPDHYLHQALENCLGIMDDLIYGRSPK